jgi:hypothetical protein
MAKTPKRRTWMVAPAAYLKFRRRSKKEICIVRIMSCEYCVRSVRYRQRKRLEEKSLLKLP